MLRPRKKNTQNPNRLGSDRRKTGISDQSPSKEPAISKNVVTRFIGGSVRIKVSNRAVVTGTATGKLLTNLRGENREKFIRALRNISSDDHKKKEQVHLDEDIMDLIVHEK